MNFIITVVHKKQELLDCLVRSANFLTFLEKTFKNKEQTSSSDTEIVLFIDQTKTANL